MTKSISIAYAIITAALGLALSSSFISSALAANPHFVGGTPPCNVTSSFQLVCGPGSVAGLGNANQAQLSATFTGTYSCSAQGAPVTGNTVSVDSRNGRVNFPPATIEAPSGGSATCTPVLTSATYSSVCINFKNNGAAVGSVCWPGSFSSA